MSARVYFEVVRAIPLSKHSLIAHSKMVWWVGWVFKKTVLVSLNSVLSNSVKTTRNVCVFHLVTCLVLLFRASFQRKWTWKKLLSYCLWDRNLFTFKHKTYFKIWKKYTATSYEFTATLVEKCFRERMVRKGRRGKIFTFNSGFFSSFGFSVLSCFAFLVLNWSIDDIQYYIHFRCRT